MYSETEKEVVMKMLEEQRKASDIAKETGISSSTIYEWEEEYNQKQAIIEEMKVQIKQLSQEGKLEEAERVARELLRLTPDKLKNKSRLIQILIKSMKLEEAEILANEILLEFPDDKYVRNQLAFIRLKQGNIKEAGRLYKEIIEIDPTDLPARSQLIKIYKEQGKLEEVEELCKERINLEPTNVPARNQLIAIYKKQGKTVEVEKLLRQILELEPNNLIARYELITIYKEQGRISEVEELCEKIIELDPINLPARGQLITIYRKQGKLGEVERVTKEILRINPSDEMARIQLKELNEQPRKGKRIDANVDGTMNGSVLTEQQVYSENQNGIIQAFRKGLRNGDITLENISEKERELDSLSQGDIAMLMAEAYMIFDMKNIAEKYIKDALKQEDVSDEIRRKLRQVQELAKRKKATPTAVLRVKLDQIQRRQENTDALEV